MGKRFPGDTYFPVMTPEEAAERTELLETIGAEEGAIDFDTYFMTLGKKDPSGTLRAAMRAFTNVPKATPSRWAEIFLGF